MPPERRARVGSVANRLWRHWHRHRAAARDAAYLVLENAELGRVDQIVGEVHREERRANRLEPRAGVVVLRRLERIEHVVRVVLLHVFGDERLERFVGSRESRPRELTLDGIAPEKEQRLCRGAEARRLRLVVATFPRRIVANRVDDDAPPHPVSPRDLGRKARERHQRIHRLGVLFTPEPGVHSAHRRPDHEAKVVDSEPLADEAPLGLDHVEIAIMGKPRAEPVTRLRRTPVPEIVRQNQEVAIGIENAAGSK